MTTIKWRPSLLASAVLIALAPLSANAGVLDIPDALIAYALDDAAATAATVSYLADRPDEGCLITGRATGTAAGHSPFDDIIFGHDIVVASATCQGLPSIVRLQVEVQWHENGRHWNKTEFRAECDNLTWPNPTTTPPCALRTDVDPGPAPTQQDPGPPWLNKCRRAVARLLEPDIGQPPVYIGFWGCSQSLAVL